MITTNLVYPWSSVTQLFRNDRNTFEVMTST